MIKASKPSAEFYSDYSASRFLRNYQWNKKTIIIEDSGLFEVYFRWWMTWMTWISHGFFSRFLSAGMWSTTWPVDDQRRSNNQLGVNGWCRAPPSNGSIPCLRKEASPVSGFKGWIWSPIWKDDTRPGKRLRNELERSTSGIFNGDSSTINRLGHGFNSKLLVCQRVSHGSPDISRYLQEQGASLTES